MKKKTKKSSRSNADKKSKALKKSRSTAGRTAYNDDAYGSRRGYSASQNEQTGPMSRNTSRR